MATWGYRVLPDYRSVKQDMSAVLTDFLRRRVGFHLGVLDDVRHVTLREGRETTRIVRQSGEVEDNPLCLRSVTDG